MFRVPPLVVTGTSSVPGEAPRRADSMIAPVTVSELWGLTIISFMATSLSGAMVPQNGWSATQTAEVGLDSRSRPATGAGRTNSRKGGHHAQVRDRAEAPGRREALRAAAPGHLAEVERGPADAGSRDPVGPELCHGRHDLLH